MANTVPTTVTGAKEFGAISDNRGVVLGDASGYTQITGTQVTNHNYSGRPETPPSPSIYIPFRRDHDFVDRGTLLDQVHQKCSLLAARVALVGLGGVGKSQLAIEYCHRTAKRSPKTWIFWVHASNQARLEQGFRDIASIVKLRGREDAQADVFKLVHDWLRDEKHGAWLLVLDNTDDATVVCPPSSNSGSGLRQPLSSYLPPSKHGSVLVTSRTKHAAVKLVEDNDMIPIEAMHHEAAHALLRKKLGDEADLANDGDIAKLAKALEYMPLALVQAGAYIRSRAPRCSVSQYLEEYDRSDRTKTSLLNQEAGHLRRDNEAKNSIIITWQISFDHVRSIRQSATDLLSLMSFFDRQGIPEYLLHYEHVDEGDSLSVIVPSDKKFDDDVETLRDFAFIKVTTANTFEMHSLVQLAMRRWLESHHQLDRWREQSIVNLSAKFPTGNFENWAICQALFPHAKAAFAQEVPQSTDARKDWATLLYNAAWYAKSRANLDEAEVMSLTSMRVRMELFSEEHIDTLSSISLVGSVKREKGHYKEAEELLKKVIETGLRSLGEEHEVTLTSMHNLALVYYQQGRWKEAEDLQVQVVEIRRRLLSEDQPELLASINNLASTYLKQGRWKEAEELHVQVLETSKRVLSEEHPETLTTMNNLATTYRGQGRWKEAEELQVQVLETSKRVLGEEHLDTLTTINNLATTYRGQGRWKEAEELQVQVLEIRKRVLSEEHPNTLTTMNNLAITYYEQGRWKEAEELHVQVLETSKRVLGEEHPDTLSSMNNLACTFMAQGKDDAAIALMEQVCHLGEHVLGPQHPDFISSLKAWNAWKEEKSKKIEESKSATVQDKNSSTKKRQLPLLKRKRKRVFR
ncbi:hypothetical protein N0V83_007612 [Neocucurbitaria cava]|uniref:NB-ARC domain-containing protein n=1 Tax=Neocucurbitaria cava TaxID=798079 RepID=A0A9W8Y504_9PLEO|nr:hypothetical protein N0V83_007612 [Neocucurbitaria cava]